MAEEWRGGQLLFLATSDGTKLAVGSTKGPLAIHQAITPGDGWALSHRATGMRICLMEKKTHALALAMLLLREIRGCLELTDVDEVSAAMPRKMAEYIYHCNVHRKLLPLSYVGWEEQE